MRFLLLLCCIAPAIVFSQFAPAAGKPGSTAIAYDSSCFKDWASTCSIRRGLRDTTQPDSGFVNVGDASAALGPAKENGVVSLGDGGSAILTFKHPIKNGPGFDFAVFENSFLDTFLELAFVEVSTDGQHYVRFPAVSLTDTVVQTPAFGYTFPEKINNLAGKYRVGYGTPFDLEELKDSAGIDLEDVRFIKIIDVIGSLRDTIAQRDYLGHKINDPWPTPFPSSGFDLDAVGVIHSSISYLKNPTLVTSKIHPNPSNGNFTISHCQAQRFTLYSMQGIAVHQGEIQEGINSIHAALPAGIYSLHFEKNNVKEMLQILSE
jgi:hypothetical protein